MDERDGVDELDGLENLDLLSPDEQELLRELIRADRQRSNDQPPGPSPISAITYPSGAHEQWHWVACDEQDRALSAFVGEFVAADPGRQRHLRDRETPQVVTALDQATGAALVAGVPSPRTGVDPDKHKLLVWLCEFRTEADASHIRDAAEHRDDGRVVCVVRSGRLCAVIVMASTWVRTKAFAPPGGVARLTEIVASSMG